MSADSNSRPSPKKPSARSVKKAAVEPSLEGTREVKKLRRFVFLPVERYIEELGQTLSYTRRAMRLTQSQMALKTQTSLSTYKRLEQGDSTVSIATLFRVVHTLDNLKSAESFLENIREGIATHAVPRRVRHSKKSGS